ncbi:HAUS augmin-like complex subunit 6 [Elgaria multicarinata webbii]|uniref:HAUS augmin-like complex subunit 6 n=1 Tax=Elgaria multicarinata webbii TaxID=159646 RepID=UPI002FCCCC88
MQLTPLFPGPHIPAPMSVHVMWVLLKTGVKQDSDALAAGMRNEWERGYMEKERNSVHRSCIEKDVRGAAGGLRGTPTLGRSRSPLSRAAARGDRGLSPSCSGYAAEMSARRPPPAWEKEHLWFYLLALDFDPTGAAAAAAKIPTPLRLGVNMSDKPNRDAFHIVAWFLFSKLDPSRCNEIFRFRFPPPDKKADSEFRKQCYEWLRRISDECGNNFPPVFASLFLSPGGPTFIHLMFHFARYVLMHHIKADSSGKP